MKDLDKNERGGKKPAQVYNSQLVQNVSFEAILWEMMILKKNLIQLSSYMWWLLWNINTKYICYTI